jgi:hypothetical protein
MWESGLTSMIGDAKSDSLERTRHSLKERV